MQSQTSDNSGLNKLKSVFLLWLSCSHTTILGCILTWMLLNKNELGSSWINFIIVVCVAPFFMGDAINHYVLGRVKLEEENNWEDIRMTPYIKSKISKLFKIYRGISIVSSYGIVTLIITNILEKPLPLWLIVTVAIIFVMHLSLCFITIFKGISPVLPSNKKQGLLFRTSFVIIGMICWYFIFKNQINSGLSRSFIFFSGVLYFFICGMLHPLPSHGSILESIIRDSILSQARAFARARGNLNEDSLNYSQTTQDIEDASIVSSNANSELEKNKSLESVDKNIDSNDNNASSDGIVPDAIIADSYSRSDILDRDNLINSTSEAEIISVEEVKTEEKEN